MQLNPGGTMSTAATEDIFNLNTLLQNADVADLDILVDYITDKGEGRLSLDSNVCKQLCASKRMGRYSHEDRDVIAKEIRLFGGNSVVNLFRGDGVAYEEVARDVASKVGADYGKDTPLVTVETNILTKILEKAFSQMSDSERDELLKELKVKNMTGTGPVTTAALIAILRAGGFKTFQLAAIVANAIAKFILGRGIAFGAMGPMMRYLSIAIGPVGWVVSTLWTVADLASPAYRVTLPCVVQIAYMRQKALMTNCKKCEAVSSKSSKFCGECGEPLKA
jgi:uncharacterized protein YaaW (UPF0174 family)